MDDDHVEAPVAPPPVVSHSLSQTYASTVQEDSIPDINEVLKKLNLSDYSSKFHDEKVDTETLVRLIFFSYIPKSIIVLMAMKCILCLDTYM